MAAAGAAPAGSQLAMVPKYSMMGPFRGHMSIKSSPFSPGSSSKLSTQYIIQDHMATHYRKLLSSKAAVDSSVPKSLHTSIKYRDQQKKERLIKAVEKYKKELVRIVSSPKFNCRSVSMGQQKEHELWFMKPQTPHSLRSQFKEKEEELKYLQFLQEVTNDILIRSCYCKEAIEDIFQMHIRSRRHDLDEVKMRRLFQDLKDELNCTYQLDPSISYTGIQHSDTSTFKTCL
ncbi:spermatogenesis-associated protein 7-like isoform X3 [Mauremys mutica]|uniref:spermatogenesis-associated protein 7-like isoform X3 n=1 Tax=Mauremys mutica TaxID=74926 RepID=UPI001D165BF3|nr:spermatogenesis-associated protein 7-like isoform X3 [Mauremys mutica]